MAYSALAVANAFIKKANKGEISSLSPMKLQKLLYFTQAWHLKLAKEPLINEDFERWTYGPVVPSVYHVFKRFGASDITELGKRVSSDGEDRLVIPRMQDDDPAFAIVNKVADIYGKYSGAQLSKVTHRNGTAWSLTESGQVIDTNLMAKNINGD